MEPDPVLGVGDPGEPGGYEFGIGLGEEFAHCRSDHVDRLLRDLAA